MWLFEKMNYALRCKCSNRRRFIKNNNNSDSQETIFVFYVLYVLKSSFNGYFERD